MSEVHFKVVLSHGRPLLARFNTETCLLERHYPDGSWRFVDGRGQMHRSLVLLAAQAERGERPPISWHQLVLNVLQASGKLEETLDNFRRYQA